MAWTESSWTMDYIYSDAAASMILKLTAEWEHNQECLIRRARAIPSTGNSVFMEMQSVTPKEEKVFEDKAGCVDSNGVQGQWDVFDIAATFVVKSNIPVPVPTPWGSFTLPNPFSKASTVRLEAKVYPNGIHTRVGVWVDGAKQP